MAPEVKGFSLYLALRLQTFPISCVLLLTQEEMGDFCTQVILDSNWTKTILLARLRTKTGRWCSLSVTSFS